MSVVRRVLGTLLALLACLLLPLALVAGWLVAVVDNTDRYVETVGPLAADARVVDAVETRLTARALVAVEDNSPAGVDLGAQLEPLVSEAVRTALESQQFRTVWEAVNTDAHTQLLAQLRASDTGQAAADDVVLDFGSVLDTVVAEVDQSLPVSVPQPGVAVPVSVLQGEQVEQARQGYDALTLAGFWLPVGFVVLLLVALVVTPLRARMMGVVAVVGAALLGVLLVALGFAREAVVAQAPAADRELTAAVWDGLTTSLDYSVYAALVVCLVLLVLALVARAVRGPRTA